MVIVRTGGNRMLQSLLHDKQTSTMVSSLQINSVEQDEQLATGPCCQTVSVRTNRAILRNAVQAGCRDYDRVVRL